MKHTWGHFRLEGIYGVAQDTNHKGNSSYSAYFLTSKNLDNRFVKWAWLSDRQFWESYKNCQMWRPYLLTLERCGSNGFQMKFDDLTST